MNYIPQIAKMLGVDVGEKFTIHCFQPDVSVDAEFADNGLVVFLTDHVSKGNSTWLMDLIQGRAEIVKKPWKPKPGDKYFYYYKYADREKIVLMYTGFSGCSVDIINIRLGNCYPTKEAAEADREKWKRFYLDDSPIDWEA